MHATRPYFLKVLLFCNLLFCFSCFGADTKPYLSMNNNSLYQMRAVLAGILGWNIPSKGTLVKQYHSISQDAGRFGFTGFAPSRKSTIDTLPAEVDLALYMSKNKKDCPKNALRVMVGGQYVGTVCVNPNPNYGVVDFCTAKSADTNTLGLGLYVGGVYGGKYRATTCPANVDDALIGMNAPLSKYFMEFPTRYIHVHIDKSILDKGVSFKGVYFRPYRGKWSKTVNKEDFNDYTLNPEVKFKTYISKLNNNADPIQYEPVEVKTSPPQSYGPSCIDMLKGNPKGKGKPYVLLTIGNQYTSRSLFRKFCGNEKVYEYLFYADGTYSRYSAGKFEYTKNTYDIWFKNSSNVTKEEAKNIVAVAHWDNLTDYFFFSDGKYVRYSHKDEVGFKTKSTDLMSGWIGRTPIAGSLSLPTYHKIYFFTKDGRFVKYNTQDKEFAFIGETPSSNTTSKYWKGITIQDSHNITAALNLQNGYSLIVLEGRKYIEYDNVRDRVALDRSYPQPDSNIGVDKQPIGALIWYGFANE